MRKWLFKMSSLAIIGALLTGMLTGCSAKEEETLMGRYVEEEAAMPEQLGDYYQISGMSVNDEDELELVIYDGQCTKYTRQEDDSYTSETIDWTQEIIEEQQPAEMLYVNGADGCDYVLTTGYTDTSQVRHLYRHTKEDEVEEVQVEGINDPDSNDILQEIKKLQVEEDGTILIGYYQGTVVYDQDGTILQEVDGALGISTYADGDTLYTIHDDNTNAVQSCTVKTQADEQTIKVQGDEVEPYGYDTYSKCGILSGDDSGTVYLQDENGISSLSAGGHVWVNVVDGSMNSLSLPDLQGIFLTKGQSDEFYVACQDNSDGTQKILSYVYDPDLPTYPEDTLSVYSLHESKTIRQGVVLFQKEHPEVQVSYYAPLGADDTTTDTTDYLKALNTELLSGGGADVLILDGMDVDSYVEKGVLEDLSDIIDPMIEAGQIETAVGDTYQQEDQIYAIPLRVMIPAIYGTGDLEAATDSMQDFFAYAKEEEPNMMMSAEQLAQMAYTLYGTKLFKEDGTLDQEALTQYYDGLSQIETIDAEYDDISILGYTVLYNKLSRLAYTQLNSPFSYQLVCDYLGNEEASLVSPTNTYMPELVTGVNKNSKEKEFAEEFLQFLLEKDQQSYNYDEGLPVNLEAFANGMLQGESERDYASMLGFEGIDGEPVYLEIPYATEDQVADLKELYGSLTTPITVDTVIAKKITQLSAEVTSGTKTTEQAVQEVCDFWTSYSEE